MKNYLENLKLEVNKSFEQICTNLISKNKIDEINMKRHGILKKINDFENECTENIETFKARTIFFLDKNNCVSSYMLNKHQFKLVIIKNTHLNNNEINSLKQNK
jgi:hypothetical protein